MQVSQILGYENVKYLGHDDGQPGPISAYETTRQSDHLTQEQKAGLQDLADEYGRTINITIPGLTAEIFHPRT